MIWWAVPTLRGKVGRRRSYFIAASPPLDGGGLFFFGGHVDILVPCEYEKIRWVDIMKRKLDQDLLVKMKAVAQGPDADLLKEFVDMLYYRREEYDTEPLSPAEQEAVEAGREALQKGDMSQFISLEELKDKYGS
jgi:hypothetical protein